MARGRNRQPQSGGGQQRPWRSAFELIESSSRPRPDGRMDHVIEFKVARGNNPVEGELAVIEANGSVLPGLPAATDEYGLVGGIYTYDPKVTKQVAIKAYLSSDPNVSFQRVVVLDQTTKSGSIASPAEHERVEAAAYKAAAVDRKDTIQTFQAAATMTGPAELHIGQVGRDRDGDGNARMTSTLRLFGEDHVEKHSIVRAYSSPQRPFWLRYRRNDGTVYRNYNWQHSIELNCAPVATEVINTGRRWVAIDMHVVGWEILGQDVLKVPPRRVRRWHGQTWRRPLGIGLLALVTLFISGYAFQRPGKLSIFSERQVWLEQQPSTQSFFAFSDLSAGQGNDIASLVNRQPLKKLETQLAEERAKLIGWKTVLLAWALLMLATVLAYYGWWLDLYFGRLDYLLASGQTKISRGDFKERALEFVNALRSPDKEQVAAAPSRQEAAASSAGPLGFLEKSAQFLTADAAAGILWRIVRGR